MAGIKVDMILWKVRENDAPLKSTYPRLFYWFWDPNWVVDPTKIGDEYVDLGTWHKRYSQTASNVGWVEYNYMENI